MVILLLLLTFRPDGAFLNDAGLFIDGRQHQGNHKNHKNHSSHNCPGRNTSNEMAQGGGMRLIGNHKNHSSNN